MSEIISYRRPYFNTQPDYLYRGYRSTVKRAPTKPLVFLPHTLSEVTGPVFGYDDVRPTDSRSASASSCRGGCWTRTAVRSRTR